MKKKIIFILISIICYMLYFKLLQLIGDSISIGISPMSNMIELMIAIFMIPLSVATAQFIIRKINQVYNKEN